VQLAAGTLGSARTWMHHGLALSRRHERPAA
jgi:hypothetical protein